MYHTNPHNFTKAHYHKPDVLHKVPISACQRTLFSELTSAASIIPRRTVSQLAHVPRTSQTKIHISSIPHNCHILSLSTMRTSLTRFMILYADSFYRPGPLGTYWSLCACPCSCCPYLPYLTLPWPCVISKQRCARHTSAEVIGAKRLRTPKDLPSKPTNRFSLQLLDHGWMLKDRPQKI